MVQIAKKKNACHCGNMKQVASKQCGTCNRAHPNTGGRSKQALAWDNKTSKNFLSRGLINVAD